MNCTLQPRDRGHRNAPAEWPPRPARIVPCTRGLVGGAAADRTRPGPERRKARRGRSRAGVGRLMRLLVDAVRPLSALGLERLDGESSLLHRARHESAHRVFLPSHGRRNLGERRALGALEHCNDLSGLTALPRRFIGLCGLGCVLAGRGLFVAGASGVATSGVCGATGAAVAASGTGVGSSAGTASGAACPRL
jgi:hypothetical protein